MKKLSIFFLLLTSLSCQNKKSYLPSDHLSPQEEDKFMGSVMRYVSDLPRGASHETKFAAEHNEHYQEQQSRHRLDSYFPSKDKTIYFLISRGAPSLVEKRVAIGGKLKLALDGTIAEYEEVFRTWKMKPDVLKQRAEFLFDQMVKGENLDRYQPNKTSEEWIEFPDGRVYYDTKSRQWKTPQ
jgi:hypothetical protein